MLNSLANLIVVLTLVATTFSAAARRPTDGDRRSAAASAPAASMTMAEPDVDADADAVAEAPEPTLDVGLAESALGRSGALRVWLALPGARVALPIEWKAPRPAMVWYRWVPLLGTPVPDGDAHAPLEVADSAFAPPRPGVYALELSAADRSQRLEDAPLLVQVPFERKENGRLNGYFIGRYPTEGSRRTDRYAPPVGFVEVSRETRDLRLSEHFTVREFLTHDQRDVWPKYLVIDLLLLDKLELVLQDLNDRGIRAERMVVMSGYRTPQYNRRGLNQGRAQLSRHQFGDAADVWIDNDGDWYMDDLNGDGRRNTRDARVMLEAVDRVEARFPELIGGAGIYPDNGAHGPFIHIDVRGHRARW